MEIKCIITDDEPIARKGLRGYVERINFLKLIGEYEDAIQLNNAIKDLHPGLLFLDIEMPQMSGLELLASLTNPPKVIITSAYEKYAIQGYEFEVVDYLLKPISFERFLKSVNRIHDLMEKEQECDNSNYIFVKCDKQIKRLQLNDILFIESLENYVTIYSTNSKEVIFSTLKNMLESLPANDFMQVHRSYIVNANQIKAIDGNMLCIGNHKVPIARNFRDLVLTRLLNNKLIAK